MTKGPGPTRRRDGTGRWAGAAPMLISSLLVAAVLTAKWLAHDAEARADIMASPWVLLGIVGIPVACLLGAFQVLFWYRALRERLLTRTDRR